MKQRTFVISDIHGGYLALKELMNKVNFDFENDKLICLGDTCDAWPNVKECFDLLSTIKNLIYLWGNHDIWTSDYYQHKMDIYETINWKEQGGQASADSFGKSLPKNVKRIFKSALPYYVDSDNRLFVHGGFDENYDISTQSVASLVWDRNLCAKSLIQQEKNNQSCSKTHITCYSEVFIGHTPTIMINKEMPIKNCEVWMIDTGASYTGKLTLIDITQKDNYIIYQSQPVNIYYPGIEPRG